MWIRGIERLIDKHTYTPYRMETHRITASCHACCNLGILFVQQLAQFCQALCRNASVRLGKVHDETTYRDAPGQLRVYLLRATSRTASHKAALPPAATVTILVPDADGLPDSLRHLCRSTEFCQRCQLIFGAHQRFPDQRSIRTQLGDSRNVIGACHT